MLDALKKYSDVIIYGGCAVGTALVTALTFFLTGNVRSDGIAMSSCSAYVAYGKYKNIK